MSAENKPFPFEINDLEPDLNAELIKYFTGELNGFVRVGPKRYFLPQKYKTEAQNIYNMELKATDIFVTSYPRSGTTVIQELVWMVINDVDYATSNAIPLAARFTFLEFSTLVHPILKQQILEENSDSDYKLQIVELLSEPGVAQLARSPSPRFIKTHLPLSLLPPTLLDTAKVVYTARDPRDVAVSSYHLTRLVKSIGFIGDFKTYWNYFIGDLSYWTPYFEHLKETWQKRNHPHVLFLFYEEIVKDLPTTVRRVSAFFSKNYTEEQVARLCEHLSFESFKNNPSVNFENMFDLKTFIPGEQSFIRKGKIGGWRDYFDDEMTQQAERWIADNLRDTDLQFPHMENS